MSDANPCFICRHPVLGLAGQDAIYDTYMLQSGERDAAAIADKAYGACHLACLAGSGWGSFWADRTVHSFAVVRRMQQLHRSDGLNVFRNAAIAQSVAVRSNGWIDGFSDRDCAAAEAVDEGLLLPVAMPANLVRAMDPGLHDEIVACLGAKQSFPLFDYVSRLGLAERLSFPEAIRRGSIVRSLERDVSKKQAGVTAPVLRVTLRYHKLLPADIAPIVMAAVR
jgi:hypothetical protein